MYNLNNLKKEREIKQLSQATIAKSLNISRSSYAMWESGNDVIPLNRLIDICNLYEISLDYALNLTTEKNIVKGLSNLEKFCNRLKEFRKEQKITQALLANKINTTQAVIANYERCRYFITTPFLYDICKKYGISADYLIGRVDTPKFYK